MYGPHLVSAHLWANAPPALQKIAEDCFYVDFDEIDTIPKAILLFDYCHDYEELKNNYLKQNKEAKSAEVKYVKFLPAELQYLIRPGLFANNMFTLLAAY